MLLHQEHCTGTLDLACDLAVHVRGHASDAAWNDFPSFGNKPFQEIRVFVIDGLDREVNPAAGHRAVCAPEVRAALWCFWLHGWLFDFPVKGVPLEVRVVFFLLKTPRGFWALFISFAHVARYGFSLGTRFCAFQRDDFLCHVSLCCLLKYLLRRLRRPRRSSRTGRLVADGIWSSGCVSRFRLGIPP